MQNFDVLRSKYAERKTQLTQLLWEHLPLVDPELAAIPGATFEYRPPVPRGGAGRGRRRQRGHVDSGSDEEEEDDEGGRYGRHGGRHGEGDPRLRGFLRRGDLDDEDDDGTDDDGFGAVSGNGRSGSVGPYQIGRKLGQGQYATVYAARARRAAGAAAGPRHHFASGGAAEHNRGTGHVGEFAIKVIEKRRYYRLATIKRINLEISVGALVGQVRAA